MKTGKVGLKDKKKIKRRKRILTAATKLFQNMGYADTTMGDIATNADVGVGTIYNYFSSKNEILLSIVTDICIEKKPDEILYENDPVQTIVSYLNGYLDQFSVFDKEIWCGWFGTLFKEPNLVEKGFELDMKIVIELAGICEKLQDRNLITDQATALEIAQLLYTPFIASMMGYIMLAEMEMHSLKKMFESQVALIFMGLRTP